MPQREDEHMVADTACEVLDAASGATREEMHAVADAL